MSEQDTIFAAVSREDLIHLCIFLAGYQAKLQDVRGECMSMVGDAKACAWNVIIYDWPVIQGAEQQIHLIRIGELGYDDAAVGRAVRGAGKPAAQLAYEKAIKSDAEPTTDGSHSCLDTLKLRASKGLARCQHRDENPKVIIQFTNQHECQEFYETLVRLWGGEYSAPNK